METKTTIGGALSRRSIGGIVVRQLSSGVVMSSASRALRQVLVAALAAAAFAASAADIGQIKISRGTVTLERKGQSLPATPGTRVEAGDVVRTGPDSSVGLTMSDNSLLSLGPNSELALDRYDFDSVTSRGQFDASLQKGSLAVISGRIAKQSPDAMKVRTPSSILGVRGTELVVSAND